MAFLLCSLLLFAGGGLCACLAGRGKRASIIGAGFAVLASVVGLVPAVQVLSARILALPAVFYLDLGALPFGRALLRLDALSAFFLVPVLLLAGLCAVYGSGYRAREADSEKHHQGAQWLFFNLLAAGLVLMITAADAFLFLLAWEVMSLAPFFLISLRNEEQKVRAASWIYLIAAHLGALCLLALFALLSARAGGSLAFADIEAAKGIGGAGAMFILAMLGFGTKSGLIPMHVWLPEAYPAASGHAAAFMAGAAINAGVYGLFRCLEFFGPPELWWSYLLIALGAVSALLGILMSLVQNDIKRALAYSSVENMGIVHLAAGFGLYAALAGSHGLSVLCFTAALLHLFNHSLYKALLFLAAGSMQNATGTTCLDQLGGLQKRLPLVGCCFALGAASICALPPFNGFAGEFFLYVSLATGGSQGEFSGLLYWAGLVVLGAVSGFTLLSFARLYGLAFLGEARSEAVCRVLPGRLTAEPAPWSERLPQLLLALLCVISAWAAPWLASVITSFVVPELGLSAQLFRPANIAPAQLLTSVNSVFLVFLLLLGGLVALRALLLRGRVVKASPTWDCGYAAPSARMQYSGASFSQPAAHFMHALLGGRVQLPVIRDYFPGSARAHLSFSDRIKDGFFQPLFLICLGLANWCKRLQHGLVSGYILYMLLVLVALLAWKVGGHD